MLHRQMQYFVSVVDCGSFTEAAEQNYISQSAISQQIQSLEQELGVMLLVRENRKFHLTAAGDYFYRHARELLRDIEAMKKETIRLGGAQEHSLKIGYLNYYGGQELQQAIADFSAIYPEVSISIMNGTHEGSGLANSPSDIESLCPDATLIKGLSVRGSAVYSADTDVEAWLETSGLLLQ